MYPEILERLAGHKILAEFREQTKAKLDELDREVGQTARIIERVQRDARSLDRRVAGQEAITNGQRIRLEAAERGYGTVNESVGRISERQDRNSDRLDALERHDRILSEIERRDKPQAAPTQNSWTDVPLKILIAALLIGMALGKAGFDPSVWFK